MSTFALSNTSLKKENRYTTIIFIETQGILTLFGIARVHSWDKVQHELTAT